MFKPTLAGILAGFTALAATFAFAATPGDTAAPATAAAPLRIGIVVPKAQLGQGNSGQDVAEPVRQLIMAYMAGPMLELVPLNARVPAQIVAEAESAGCTHVLYTSVEQKKAKKGLGGMLGAIAPAAGLLTGMGGGGDVASMMAMSAATQAVSQVAAQAAQEQALSTLTQAQAGTVKKKDEIILEYQLQAVSGGGAPLTEKLSAKAGEDGEDLLSPLVEQLATNAVTAVTTPASVPAATQ